MFALNWLQLNKSIESKMIPVFLKLVDVIAAVQWLKDKEWGNKLCTLHRAGIKTKQHVFFPNLKIIFIWGSF